MAFVEELCPKIPDNELVNIIGSTSDLEPEDVIIQAQLPESKLLNVELVKAPEKKEIQKRELPKQVNNQSIKKKVNFKQPIDKVIDVSSGQLTTQNTTVTGTPSVTQTATIAIPAIIYLTKEFGFSMSTVYFLIMLIIFGAYIFYENKFPMH